MVFRYLDRPRGGSSSSAFYDFSLGSLPSGVTLTRASAGYRTNSAGILASETTNVARFDYTPVTLAARGLLVEEARTELYTYNNDLSNAVWVYNGCTPTHNSTAGPDGTVTATLLTEGVTTAQNVGRLASAYVLNTIYMHRVYAKANTRNWIAVYWDPNRFGGTGFSYFNVSTGALGTASAGMNTFIRPVANGFYECTVIGVCTSTGNGNNSVWLANADNGRTYTGDGVSSLYYWGWGLQAGSTADQFISTGAAAATRSADVALITNASAISDQCWIIRARTPRKLTAGAANTVFQVDDGANNNRRAIYYQNGILTVLVQNAGVTQCSINTAAVANDTDFILACRFADNNFAVSLNGGAIVTDLSGTNPVGLTAARVGVLATGGFAWNSTIKTIETRRTATDAELPLLST